MCFVTKGLKSILHAIKLLFLLVALQPAVALDSWRLVWQDEFDGSRLDAEKWLCFIGGNGFGNKELEYYTDRLDNVHIENGMLVIKAIKETYTGMDGVTRRFTSGRVGTQGKFSQAYGRFEARIKIPYGHGLWPRFWMLHDANAPWPVDGEIDIMENSGRVPSAVHGMIHGPGYSGDDAIGGSYALPTGGRFSDDFHVYAIEWEPEVIRWYVDNTPYQSVRSGDLSANKRWVFDRPFFVLVGLAVGGNWPGSPDRTTLLPQSMYVDYVRVYKRD